MVAKTQRFLATAIIAATLFCSPIVIFSGLWNATLLQAAPEPEWVAVCEPVRPAFSHSDLAETLPARAVSPAVFNVAADQTPATIIHVSAALEALSGTVSRFDGDYASPLFGTDFDDQFSQLSMMGLSLANGIPLPPILDGPCQGADLLSTEPEQFSGLDPQSVIRHVTSQSGMDPFLESDESFVQEAPGVRPQVAAFYQPDPQPTPSNLVPPPATGGAPETSHPQDGSAQLFQKRVDELNRSLSGVQLGYPLGKGAFPPDRATQLNPALPPMFVSGADGWFEPRPNRYSVPFSYQPLYFEEMNLERCGIGHGFFQPFCSSAAFVKNTITLPYQLVAHPPRSLVETPGDCPSCSRFPCKCKD